MSYTPSAPRHIIVELPNMVVLSYLAMHTKEEMNMTRKQVHEVLTERIKQLCKEKGMSYYKLSYRAAIPMTTLIHIMEGDTQNPGIHAVMKICDGFGMTMKEFFDSPLFEREELEED